jgi:hypothetical protein
MNPNKKPTQAIPPLALRGKPPVQMHFHRDGSVSFRDVHGHWTQFTHAVPPSVITQLERHTRARLWYRNFQVERVWAEVNA